MNTVGRSIPRREDRPLLQGRGCYLDDVVVAEVLHARFVRSPVAHGLIKRIDVAEAAALPGVVAVFLAGDLGLGPLLPLLDNPDAVPVPRPVLAHEKVRFAGEAVALVVATDPYVSEDAAELVTVEIDPLPALASTAAALQSEAPPLHDHPTNVLYERRFAAGDAEPGPVVVQRTFSSQRQTALPMEPRGILVQPADDALTVWSSTQSPHLLATTLAEALGRPVSEVHVNVPDVGGGFGLKAHVYPEELAVAAAAQALCRPVKWVEDRADNLASSCHARGQTLDVTITADEDGRLRSIDADVVVDMGAYGVHAHGHLLEAAGTPSMLPGPYRLPAYRFRSRAVATTKAPLGAYRGVGLPVATFVHERAMDLIAAATGLDRAEVRRRNLLQRSDLPFTSLTGQRYDSGDYPAALQKALEGIGYAGFADEQEAALAEGRLLGLGMAVYVEYAAVGSAVFAARGMRGLLGYDEADVVLGSDGIFRVWTTLPTAGQGLNTTFAQLAADDLGVEAERVEVQPVSTAIGGMRGNGTFASRSAVSGGGAIREACTELRRRLLEDAADELEVAAADLELADGEVRVKGAPGSGISLADLAKKAPAGRYDVVRRHDPSQVVYPYGAHACRVEVDPISGLVKIVDYVVVEDCGQVINPAIAEGQTQGAVAQGIAGALYEELPYDEHGQLRAASLMDYLVPTAAEIPLLRIEHIHVPTDASITGCKGLGESGTLAPGAAIANAVSDAVGAECNTTPIRPSWVRAAAQERLRRCEGATCR
ncbi:xanthine dehydrogenase family protein molybdopterin-binding subunit [Pseudonocardia thermophila]|uniref:xanthine dehydrogenase family protein molybdopterin-binding subunit n=1 Tax=Pseudonocardia thermophila TaxID=1848 RepID=UPI00248DB444|nr:xanthine dehydrogenase family protein molybdopterin-binding subunit [Pseudonocardia thermophila]